MRILVITPTFLPLIGGAELGIYELYRRIGRRHHVRILTPRHSDGIVQRQGVQDTWLTDQNIEVMRCANYLDFSRMRGYHRLAGFLPPLSIGVSIAALKEIAAFAPDIVNFQYALPNSLASILANRATSVPIVISLISRQDVIGPETNPVNRLLLKLVTASADYTIAITGYMFREQSMPSNMEIIPFGVDMALFKPTSSRTKLRQQYGIPEGHSVLFSLQRLAGIKRVDVLLHALALLFQVGYQDITLILGGKGPEESHLRRLADELGIQSHVRFTGYIPETSLPDYFNLADIFVFHSNFETFGIVLAQAMAAGLPIVSVKSTAIPYVVENGVNGLLVEPNNPRQFAAAIAALLNNPMWRERLAQNNRVKAQMQYDWDTIAEVHEKVFTDLVSGQG